MYILTNKENYRFLSWVDIYWGIEAEVLKMSMASHFAEYVVAKNNIESDIAIEILILDTLIKEDVLFLVKKIITLTDMCLLDKEKSLNKLRYFLIRNLRDEINDNEILLEEIEKIYCDFNYPTDMEEFIPYMPIKSDYNPNVHTPSENQQRLINLLDDYLSNEKLEL